MKKISITLLAFIVIIAAGTTLFFSNLDSIIAEQIETHGSAALGNKVSVNSVETNLKEGSALINGLSIANHPSYQAKNAIEFNTISAKVDYKSAVIESVEVFKPTINAELRGAKSNFQDIVNNIPASTNEEEVATSDDEITLTINRFALNQATLNIASDQFKAQSFTMDDFVVFNLSGTPEQIAESLTNKLIKHISSQVKSHVSKALKDRAKDKATEKLNETLKEKLGDKVKGFKFKLG